MTLQSVIVWADCPVLQSTQGETLGEWVFRGTTVPYSAVLDRIGKYTVDQIAAQYPSVRRDQIIELLDFVAESAEPDEQLSYASHNVQRHSK